MGAIGLNHVSVSARDLDESVRFYVEVLGLELIPTPNFGIRVQWLLLGDRQLHIFERADIDPPTNHHFAVDVDDFEAVYLAAKERGIHDVTAFGSNIYRLPDGAVQMYLRDPGGNLVEIDWPDATTLDPAVVGEIRPLPHPQDGDAANGSLYVGRPRFADGRA